MLACLCHVTDGETLESSAARCRVTSVIDPLFSLLSSSAEDASHRPVVDSVTANFIRLLTHLVSTADIDFTVKVLVLHTQSLTLPFVKSLLSNFHFNL